VTLSPFAFHYITNELKLPAFALVLIYKHRWDQEKIFYQLKSKFHERKSWASKDDAKQAQAIFECLTHNLILLLEQKIINEEDLTDEIEQKKKVGREK
jgi:transposase